MDICCSCWEYGYKEISMLSKGFEVQGGWSWHGLSCSDRSVSQKKIFSPKWLYGPEGWEMTSLGNSSGKKCKYIEKCDAYKCW